MTAASRFGDGVRGELPDANADLRASYRVGGGRRGNIGAGAIAHVVSEAAGIAGVSNPLPARGGADPEPIEQVRLYAPAAFRTQERCVTAADYREIAERQPDVRRAAVELQWTGSWQTAIVAVQRQGGRPVDPAFCEAVRATLDGYRMIGHDVEVRPPDFTPLDIVLAIVVAPDAFRGAVKQALRETFSRLDMPGGRRGFFHPERFTFGQPVYLSHVIAAATAVPGVARADVMRFQRWGQDARGEREAGRIPIGPLEIARLDASPVAPQLGTISFDLVGGR